MTIEQSLDERCAAAMKAQEKNGSNCLVHRTILDLQFRSQHTLHIVYSPCAYHEHA